MKSQQGFNLLELMLTVGLLAVILATAFPSLTTYLDNRRLSATAQEISDMLSLGRQQAVSRGENVLVCWNENDAPLGNVMGTGVTVAADEFVVIAPANNDVLARRQVSGSTLFEQQNINNQCLVFSSSGRTNALAGSFFVCRRAGDPVNAREIQIDLAGRALINSNNLSATPAC